MSNPSDQILPVQTFYGGRSGNSTIGPKASFAYGRSLDFRSDPQQLTVLPGPRKISGSTVTDLPLNIVQVDSGDRYAVGDTGNFYKIATDNTVTEIATSFTESGAGLLYRNDTDAIYLSTANSLERYAPVSGTPSFDESYAESKSADSNAYRTGGAATYSVPTSLSESATAKCSFQPDIEPFYSIKVKIVAKGTGDLTLTLHDGVDTQLAQVTVPNASLTNGALAEFVFPSQVRGYVKPNARTYHFHLHSTASGTTVQVATASNLETADFELWAYRFVETNNGLHPVAQFLQYTLIGNGNYLSVWEPLSPTDPSNTEFNRHRLTFPTGFEVCGITTTNEFAAIACEKRATDGTKDFQEGKIFIWDGFSQTYNLVIDVSGGAPEGLHTYDNNIYFVVKGTLCAWFGGENIVKVLRIADTDNAFTSTIDETHVYPNMLTVRDNLLHVGYPSTTTNEDIEHGVYSWGANDKDYPSAFGYDYVISTQTRKNTAGTLEIGCVRNFGDEMYIGWKDGANYGIDIVDSACNPAPTFSFRTLVFNAGITKKVKLALRVGIDTAALPSNVTLQAVHKLDNADEVSHTTMATGAVEKIATIQSGRFRRMQFGFDGTCTGTESPTVYDVTLVWNGLPSERVM